MPASQHAPKARERERERTYRVVISIGVNRHSHSLVSRLHGEVLCAETWGLEALGLDIGESTNRSKGLGQLTDFGEDCVDVEVNHALGRGSKLNLTIVGRDRLRARMSVVDTEVLVVIHKAESDSGEGTLKHVL